MAVAFRVRARDAAAVTMISSKDLTPDQVEAIKSWATAGAQLPDIQGKLLDEYSLNATYMDTRFLILDFGIELEK